MLQPNVQDQLLKIMYLHDISGPQRRKCITPAVSFSDLLWSLEGSLQTLQLGVSHRRPREVPLLQKLPSCSTASLLLLSSESAEVSYLHFLGRASSSLSLACISFTGLPI